MVERFFDVEKVTGPTPVPPTVMKIVNLWKNIPSWLRGGLYGIAIFIIIVLSTFLSNWLSNGVTDFSEFVYKVLTFMPILIVIKFSDVGNIFLGLVLIWIGNPILFFSIGAFTGWVVGKIKSSQTF